MMVRYNFPLVSSARRMHAFVHTKLGEMYMIIVIYGNAGQIAVH